MLNSKAHGSRRCLVLQFWITILTFDKNEDYCIYFFLKNKSNIYLTLNSC